MIDIGPNIRKAEKVAREEQPWEGYYLVRGAEIENLLKLMSIDRLGKVLDVGCGNGFVASLISSISDEVMAVDLYFPDPKSHTVSIESARKLIPRLAAGKVTLLGGSVESIPFKDEVFDTVLSLYAMHYLKDRTAAFSELKRVVKKDGIIILVLPNFIERIYAFFQFYLYLVIKFFERGLTGQCGTIRNALDLSKVKENYKYFPFPGPYGAYKNSALEMFRHMPFNWNSEFRKAGFNIKKSLTTIFVPYPLLLTVSFSISKVISRLSKPLTMLLGDKPVIKYFGYNYCTILKK